MELEKLSRQVLRGNTVEEILGKFDWKDFEGTVREIFSQSNFRIKNNFRFKTRRRFEIDLIAVRWDFVFCVDCKRWSGGREKSWSISKAARDQEGRTKELKKFLKSNPIAKRIMKVSGGRFVPMLVTLHQERILKEGGTYVVPVGKLNSFILRCDEFL